MSNPCMIHHGLLHSVVAYFLPTTSCEVLYVLFLLNFLCIPTFKNRKKNMSGNFMWQCESVKERNNIGH